MGLKINFMKKEFYTPPVMTPVGIETLQILAGSFTGNAQDSDDSEFGAPAKHSETWGDLWNK